MNSYATNLDAVEMANQCYGLSARGGFPYSYARWLVIQVTIDANYITILYKSEGSDEVRTHPMPRTNPFEAPYVMAALAGIYGTDSNGYVHLSQVTNQLVTVVFRTAVSQRGQQYANIVDLIPTESSANESESNAE
ncbi:hypothetical protein [Lacticaseibacillus saniviri]